MRCGDNCQLRQEGDSILANAVTTASSRWRVRVAGFSRPELPGELLRAMPDDHRRAQLESWPVGLGHWFRLTSHGCLKLRLFSYCGRLPTVTCDSERLMQSVCEVVMKRNSFRLPGSQPRGPWRLYRLPAGYQNSAPPIVAMAPLSFEPLLDSDEAAALLKIHPKTLQRLARNGEICGVHVGKLWRFRVSALNDWLNRKIA